MPWGLEGAFLTPILLGPEIRPFKFIAFLLARCDSPPPPPSGHIQEPPKLQALCSAPLGQVLHIQTEDAGPPWAWRPATISSLKVAEMG